MQKLRTDGICTRCLKKNDRKDRSICSSCRASEKNRIRKSPITRHEKYKREHRCILCGKNNDGSLLRCSKCNEKSRKRLLDRYYIRVKNGLCGSCGKPALKGYKACQKCKDKSSRLKIESAKKLYAEIIQNYGGMCACCKESNPMFLTIDHINNDGKQHRLEIGAGGRFYRWLRKNGFPKEGLQLYCYNCNYGKQRNKGVCPHEPI